MHKTPDAEKDGVRCYRLCETKAAAAATSPKRTSLPAQDLPDPLVQARRLRARASGSALHSGHDRNHPSTDESADHRILLRGGGGGGAGGAGGGGAAGGAAGGAGVCSAGVAVYGPSLQLPLDALPPTTNYWILNKLLHVMQRRQLATGRRPFTH